MSGKYVLRQMLTLAKCPKCGENFPNLRFVFSASKESNKTVRFCMGERFTKSMFNKVFNYDDRTLKSMAMGLVELHSINPDEVSEKPCKSVFIMEIP